VKKIHKKLMKNLEKFEKSQKIHFFDFWPVTGAPVSGTVFFKNFLNF
jgi:hypothetical protein